jgi:LysM repeat protein
LLLPLLGLIPLVAAVLASELPLFGGSSSPPPEAARPAATAPPAANAPITTSGAPTVQSLPAPPQPTSGPTPIGANLVAAAPTGTAANGQAQSAAQTTQAQGAQPQAQGAQPSTAPQANAPFIAYRVQPGDTLRSVASMYGVSTNSVTNASGLTNPDLLRVGQVLTIPNQPGYLYRVQPGETLDQIAARTGMSTDTIATVSRLTAAGVRAGDVLLIPDLAAAKSK